MTPLIIGIIGFGVLFLFMFAGLQIGLAMGLVGFFGFAYFQGFDAALGILRTVPYRTFFNYDLSVVPLFVLMGEICFFTEMSKELYDTAHSWLGHFPGGLAMATVGACAIFSAVSGSAVACAATMGVATLSEMKRYNYDPALATGCVASGASLDIMIPPSIILILYGIIAGQSIGKLYIAGFIPGIILAIFYLIAIYILCKRNPLLGPRGPKTSFKQKIFSLKSTWAILTLFLLVMGGLYFGIFSPTEAAGIGAFGAFVFALARRKLSWQAFRNSLIETGRTTAMVFTIVLGAMIFGYFLSISRLPFELASLVGGLPVSRYVIFAAILVLYIILGGLMDELAMLLLTVPVFYPLILALGFDPIWFGIMVALICEMGIICPPVGMNVFVIHGVAKDIPMWTIYRGIFPFFYADIVLVVLLVAFPQIALFLPAMMK